MSTSGSEAINGMPKLQLLRDFFLDLEGPYKTIELDEFGNARRIAQLSMLAAVAAFDDFKAIVKVFRQTARIREVRCYNHGIEVVKYDVWLEDGRKRLYGPGLLDVKYGPEGELVSYTFDPAERTPMDVEALLHDDTVLNRVEDILDFCWNMKSDEGMFVQEVDGMGAIHVWNIGEEDAPRYSLEWIWGREERLRMGCIVTSASAMMDFVRRYIISGLSAAQQGLKWTSVYAVPTEDFTRLATTRS